MKFDTTTQFDSDLKALPREHRKHFLAIIADFNAACDAYLDNPGGYVWPARLRVRRMVSARGIWELTWNFASPDGRATFEFTTDNGEPILLWRRVGDHSIYREP